MRVDSSWAPVLTKPTSCQDTHVWASVATYATHWKRPEVFARISKTGGVAENLLPHVGAPSRTASAETRAPAQSSGAAAAAGTRPGEMGPCGKVLLGTGLAASCHPLRSSAPSPAAARGDLLGCAGEAGILQQLPTRHLIQDNRISPVLN